MLLPVAQANECDTWFKTANLKPGGQCLFKCADGKTNAKTFRCTNLCGRFCKNSLKEQFIFNISVLYPGLTKAERTLSALYSKKMLTGYRLTWKAEKLCLSLFKTSGTNDASDACRHFIWAGLLYKNLGPSFSAKVVYAHEKDPNQTEKEKEMDEINNRLGFQVAEKLLIQNKFSERALIKSFQDKWKSGQVVVLRSNTAQKK